MKKRFVALLFFLVLCFCAIAAASPADRLISWYLSRQYCAFIEVHHVTMPQWGKVQFRDLRAGSAKDSPAWFWAEEGTLFFGNFRYPLDSVQIHLRGVTLGEIFQKKTGLFLAWFSHAGVAVGDSAAMASDSVYASAPRFDEVFFLIHRAPGSLVLRVLRARSRDFWFGGGVEFRESKIAKLNVHWAFSKSIFSQWPAAVTQKMMRETNGWRSAGIRFGANTWTLRGPRGPLLQFSGNLTANNR